MQNIKFSALASGIKKNKAMDLSLISLPENCKTVAVFTQNVFSAAPVYVSKKHITNDIRALVINSGNANAGTGQKGIDNANKSCELVADKLKIKPEQVLAFSTGVIGQQLDLSCIKNNIDNLINNLKENNIDDVAKAIMTTDLVSKKVFATIEYNNKKVNIVGIAKGSGMICPNMATLLAFIFSDIDIEKKDLKKCLKIANNKSFNRITVDGDTSTNDSLTLSATGLSKVKYSEVKDEFQAKLNQVLTELAHMIVKDGEGATKFIEIEVKGANSEKDCLEVLYTIAHSPLVKTAFFASDANWGRILAAIGRAKVKNLDIKNIDLYLEDVCLIKNGEPHPQYSEESGSKIMQKSAIKILVNIGKGKFSDSIWTTDLSYDYIKINAEYRS